MQLIHIPADSAGADPIGAPADVPHSALFQLPEGCTRLWLVSTGAAMGVTIYAQEDVLVPSVQPEIAPADRRWIQIGEAHTTSTTKLTSLLEIVTGTSTAPIASLPQGRYYARVTSGTGAGRLLLIGYSRERA